MNLELRLAAAVEDVRRLVVCHAVAWPLICDPRHATAYDLDRVTGSHWPSAPWPEPELRKSWLASQLRVHYAHAELHRLGWGVTWKLARRDVPVHRDVAVAALTTVLAGLSWLQESDPPPKPTHTLCDQIAKALDSWPDSLWDTPKRPLPPVRQCTGCANPARPGGTQCWRCLKARQRSKDHAA